MRDGLGSVQSVLLLGGTSDIGLAIVRRLAQEHRLKRVVLASRDIAAGGLRATEMQATCRARRSQQYISMQATIRPEQESSQMRSQ